MPLEKNTFDEIIYNSEDWIIIRKTKEGIHLHQPKSTSIVLITELLCLNNTLWDFTKEQVWKYKKTFNK